MNNPEDGRFCDEVTFLSGYDSPCPRFYPRIEKPIAVSDSSEKFVAPHQTRVTTPVRNNPVGAVF